MAITQDPKPKLAFAAIEARPTKTDSHVLYAAGIIDGVSHG